MKMNLFLARICSVIVMAYITGNVSATNNLIVIETSNTALVYRIDQKDVNLYYFGETLKQYDDFKQVENNSHLGNIVSSFKGLAFNESSLRVTHHDGVLSTELEYVEHAVEEIDANIRQTTVVLKDNIYDFYVDVVFKAYKQQDVISISTRYRNSEPSAVHLYHFASSYLPIFSDKYYLTLFHGEWFGEMNMHETELVEGIRIIDSKQGVKTSDKLSPSFLVSLDQRASENSGEVIGGTLAWSGNWRHSFEIDYRRKLHIVSGINPFGSDFRLESGNSFTTPEMLISYSSKGKGQISRNFHSWARQYGLLGGNEERPLIINNWEATFFSFDEEMIKEIISDGADLGIELFVLDDGWFGTEYPRNNDRQGLGDWEVNREKLPGGIESLIEKAHSEGIKFGLWVEPEMVNKDSELFKKHPEWAIQEPGRRMYEQRNQYVLDLSNPEVQDFIVNTVSGILEEHPEIYYIKWDANSHFSNVGSPYLAADNQSYLGIAHTHGLYAVLERVRDKHPTIIMQVCASGGGRVDYGSLKYFHEFWSSDNTDAYQRIFIQWGTSHFFPAIAMGAHVSDVPNGITRRSFPIKFRFDVAMSGRLGMELQPSHMTREELDFSKNALEYYKRIRPVVQFGDLYRLISPYEHNVASLMYVNEPKSKAVLFVYHHKWIYGDVYPDIKLQGLDPDARYLIREINKAGDFLIEEGQGPFSGEFLMKNGFKINTPFSRSESPLTVSLMGEYDSVILEIEMVK